MIKSKIEARERALELAVNVLTHRVNLGHQMLLVSPMYSSNISLALPSCPNLLMRIFTFESCLISLKRKWKRLTSKTILILTSL